MESRDLVLFAAHPDDDAIMAGEFATEAAQDGRHVEIVMLTCGDREPGTDRAGARQQESVDAWASVGVARTRVHLLGARNSPLGGESLIDDQSRKALRATIVGILETLPKKCCVIIPAAGECHVDHRTLRALVIDVVNFVDRDDLRVWETPEYNPFYSLARCDTKSVRYLVSMIPIAGRCLPRLNVPPRPGFPSGGRGFVLEPDETRFAQKLQMLRFFKTEGPSTLIRHHGRPDEFREIVDLRSALVREPWGYIRVGYRRLGISVVSAWTAIIAGVFCGASLAGLWVVASLEASTSGRVITVLVAIVILCYAILNRMTIERRVLYFTAMSGMALAGVAR